MADLPPHAVEVAPLSVLQHGCDPLAPTDGRSLQALVARSRRSMRWSNTGLMLSMERDRSKLLGHLLAEARRLLNCDGATMFLVTEEKTLRFELRTRGDTLPSNETRFTTRSPAAPTKITCRCMQRCTTSRC